MSDIKACLAALVADKQLDQDSADKVLAQVERKAQAYQQAMSLSEAQRKAAAEAIAEQKAKAKRARVLAAKQIQRTAEITAAAKAHPAGLKEGYLSFLTKDYTGKARHTNVEYRASAITSFYNSRMLDLFDQYAPKGPGGWVEDQPGLRDVVREIFGEDTGNPQAKAAAKAWAQGSDEMLARFNRAGGDIAQREDWRLPQSHDMLRIRQAGYEKWRQFVDDQGVLVFDEDGVPLAGLGRDEVLRQAYATLSTGGLNKLQPGAAGQGKKLANKGVDEHRVLHFPNGDAWLAYHQEYGAGSVYSTFAGHLQGRSRDIALLEVLGPNPAAMARFMRDSLAKEAGHQDAGRIIERTYAEIVGNQDIATGWRRYVYAALQGTRNLLRSSQMGSALLSAVSDLATVRETSGFNGLSMTNIMENYLKQLNPANPADRQLAKRFGLVTSATLAAMRNSRVVDEDMGRGFTGRLATTVFDVSGLTAHTDGLRKAFGLEFISNLGELSGRFWTELDDPTRAALERAGLDTHQWNRLRSYAVTTEGGVKFLDPMAAMAHPDALTQEAGVKLQALILQETDYAVPQPDARVRATMNFGTKGNTLIGEIWRTVAMYRSYPVTVMLTHGYRAAYAGGKGAFGLPKGVAYAGSLFASMSVLGAFALQSKQLASGKDPRDMTDARFWGQAVLQGGGLGIFGDFFGAALSRTDKDLAATLAGTGYGLVSDVINVTTRNAMAEAEGKNSRTATDVISFLQRYTPGSNLWYAKTATDRLFWAQLKLMADDEAPRAFARMERNAMRDYRQSWYWRPGQALPDRLPDLTAAIDLEN